MAANTGSGKTGDMGNNLWKLLREVQRMKLKVEPNIRGLSQGLASAFLPLLHAAFMSYSLPLSKYLAESGVELYGRSDLRFVEGLYKVMRDTFQYRPQLTKDQFLSPGYTERKIIMTFDLLQLCQTKHHQLDGAKTGQKRRKKRIVHSGSSMNHHLASSNHSVQEMDSCVLREAPESRLVASESGGFSVSLPPSPPLSPLQTPSPTTAHGCPLLCETSELELTPCSTPLKPSGGSKQDVTTSSSSHHHTGVSVRVVREPVLDTGGGSNEDDQEEEEEEETQKTMTHPDVQHLGEEQQSSKEVSKHTSREGGDSAQLQLGEVCQQLGQLAELVERMSARLVLLETQMKLFEGAQLKTDHQSVQQQPLQATTSTQTEETLLTHTPSPSSHLHTSSTPLQAAARGVSHWSPSPHTPSISTLNSSHSHTPEETKRVIERLRTRAQHTRQLLCRASQADNLHPVQ